jgi:ribonuclease M5
MKMREVIVVEGRDDTVAVRRAVEADTIETGGSAIGEEVYAQIELAQARRGVIILTDPDHAGERIRRLVAARVPGCRHAFVEAAQAVKKGKIGVEYATPDVIRDALVHVRSEGAWVDQSDEQAVRIEHLLQTNLINHPQAHLRRLLIGQALRIGCTNGKQMVKRLNMFGITAAELLAAVAALDKQTSS